MKWLRYSGISVTITLNPLHWRWYPWWQRDVNEWAGPNERTYVFGILALSMRVWIDDGSW